MRPIRLRLTVRPPLEGEGVQIFPLSGLFEITVDEHLGPQIRNVRTHGAAERDDVANLGARVELEVEHG